MTAVTNCSDFGAPAPKQNKTKQNLSLFPLFPDLFAMKWWDQGCHVLLQGHSMWNARLDESQAGIKISRRNNNLIHADDITIIVESEEELESLLMKVKEESEKAGLKLNIQQAKIMAPSHIISWQIEGKSGSSNRFYFSGLQNHCRWLQP